MLTLFSMHYSHRIVTLLEWQGDVANVVFYYLTKVGSFWVFALLIIIFAFGKGLLSRVLSLKLMILLGEISFSLYLVHTTVLKWYEINSAYFQNLPEWCKVSGYWLLSLFIAYLIHKIVEIPCRKLIIALPKTNIRQMFGMVIFGQQGIFLAFFAVIIAGMLNLPSLLMNSEALCPPALCQSLTDSHRLETPASFGGYIELSAASLSPYLMTKEDRRLDLLFNVQSLLPDGYNVAVHIAAADGAIIEHTDFQLIKARGLAEGEKWVESVKIPNEWLLQAKYIGIAIYADPKKLMPVTYPKTDYGGGRILIDLSQVL